ncbi:DoxX family protein [Phreatobacter stygius]|uniref:DoxX family protein n=1 Tax=Phreatobacter stygius TaxID=1940610 RepID=A0A4D7BHM1_9HYPH|nr:DoxX family protein [Phreatobacter stygius]QCI67362.1 DoxX family protein [Phreatobacter stygius]
MVDQQYAPYAALLLRVSMGILFILHGLYLKVFVFSMAGASGYFGSLGLPGWFAWVVMIYETIGGIMLILGIYARPVAVFLGVHLLAAAYLGHGNAGWQFTNRGGGYEFPVFWAIACFALALLGDGIHAMKRSVMPQSN